MSITMRTKPYFTKAEADQIIALIIEKLKADTTKQKTIRAKIRGLGFWAEDFGLRDGYTMNDFLLYAKIITANTFTTSPKAQVPLTKVKEPERVKPSTVGSRNSDESYIIDLCDEILEAKALRQYKFDFLKGDSGRRLPVDAYYPELTLVVEYREKQHTEEVKFFDKRKTVSGMSRGEQRKLYDQRRRDVLPQHGIKLIELEYGDFEHTRNKKLVRNKKKDLAIVESTLSHK